MNSLAMKTLGNIEGSGITVSTGSAKLDADLNGGYKGGNIYEIFGKESTGKTSILLRALDNAKSSELRPLLIESEFKLNPYAIQELGVSQDITVIQSNSQIDIFQFLLSPAFYENFDMVGIDSLTAIISDKDRTNPIGADIPSDSAMLTDDFMKKFKEICHKHNIICIFVDQMRYKAHLSRSNSNQKMGFEDPVQYDLSSTACNALEHSATARIQLYMKKDIYSVKEPSPSDVNAEPIGQETLYQVVKNHQGQPGTRGKFTFIYGSGFSEELEMGDIGIKCGILGVEDGAVTYEGQVIALNKLQLIEFLKNRGDVRAKIVNNAKRFYSNLQVLVNNENNESNAGKRNC